MGKSREVVPVSLTARQRRELERLWFVFGNYGSKTTKGNHSFIQGLLERGQDERPLKLKGYIPTDECEQAVERILHSAEQQENVVTTDRIVAEGARGGGQPSTVAFGACGDEKASRD